MKVVILLAKGLMLGTVMALKRRGEPTCLVELDCDSLSTGTRISVSPRSLIPFEEFDRRMSLNASSDDDDDEK